MFVTIFLYICIYLASYLSIYNICICNLYVRMNVFSVELCWAGIEMRFISILDLKLTCVDLLCFAFVCDFENGLFWPFSTSRHHCLLLLLATGCRFMFAYSYVCVCSHTLSLSSLVEIYCQLRRCCYCCCCYRSRPWPSPSSSSSWSCLRLSSHSHTHSLLQFQFIPFKLPSTLIALIQIQTIKSIHSSRPKYGSVFDSLVSLARAKSMKYYSFLFPTFFFVFIGAQQFFWAPVYLFVFVFVFVLIWNFCMRFFLLLWNYNGWYIIWVCVCWH